MQFYITHSDAYEPVLKDLLFKCEMPNNKTHKGYKFLIVLRGVAIGGCRLILSENKRSGLIASVCILEEFRGLGAGQALMDKVHNMAFEWGVNDLYLAAVDKAVDFYSKLGYQKISSKHPVPYEFIKPMVKIWEEYEKPAYPYKITEYMRLVL